MKHKKKSKDSKHHKHDDAKRVKVQGKPENYFKLCQQQGDNNFSDMVTEEPTTTTTVNEEKSQLNYKNIIAMKATERERLNRTRQEQLLGGKELPGVLRCLALVYDFQKSCLIEKPREAAVKPPVVVIPQPEPQKLREVPVVPPELVPNVRSSRSITVSEYNRRSQEQKRLKSVGLPGSEQKPETRDNPMFRHYSVGHSRPTMQHTQPMPTMQPGTPGQPIRHTQPMHPMPPMHPNPAHGARTARRIIVVPSEYISLVTLHNVQMLLQERRFITPDLMRRNDVRHLQEVIINRTFRGEEQQYRVIDNVSRLSHADWENVVAVFVLDPHTQFIGWPFHGDPVVICRRVCAFHIHFRGHPIYRELEKLNINMLRLPEMERNMDGEILMDFWRKLDFYMSKRDHQSGLQLGLK